MSNYKNIDIHLALEEVKDLKEHLQKFLSVVGEEKDNVKLKHYGSDEIFIKSRISVISEYVESILREVNYLDKNIIAEGELYLNSLGRYEINPLCYLSSGSTCELLVKGIYDKEQWIKTKIEYDSNMYYATEIGKNVSLNGLRARVRQIML